MDDNTSYFQSKRLTKQSPSSTAIASRMSQDSTAATHLLRRHPSASGSPSSAATISNDRETREHQRTLSSASSKSPSPNLPAVKYSSQSHQEGYSNRYPYSPRQSLGEKSSEEVISSPSDTSDTVSPLDSTKASSYQNSLRRSGQNSMSQMSSNTAIMSPYLRQSASFSVGDRSKDPTSPLLDSGSTTPKRYSDEGKNVAPWKKKSGFSSFMNSVLGSPRNVKISAPENPVHVTHVGFDNVTGQFTVRIHNSDHLIAITPSHSEANAALVIYGISV